jgi:hypothetical protein
LPLWLHIVHYCDIIRQANKLFLAFVAVRTMECDKSCRIKQSNLFSILLCKIYIYFAHTHAYTHTHSSVQKSSSRFQFLILKNFHWIVSHSESDRFWRHSILLFFFFGGNFFLKKRYLCWCREWKRERERGRAREKEKKREGHNIFIHTSR